MRLKTRLMAIIPVAFFLFIGALVAGGFRAQFFGFSAKTFIGEIFFIGIYGAVPAFILLIVFRMVMLHRRNNDSSNLIALFHPVLCILFISLSSAILAETWCGIEEYSFIKEIESRGLIHSEETVFKTRSYPYESSSLYYSERGGYGAHD